MSISVIHTYDVDIERMQERDGWAISEFRLPITGETGSKTTVFHSIFRPGSTHAKHLHTVSDEIAVYLSGNGVVGQGDSREVVSTGHCRLMPKGSEHFFFNETKDEDARVIGFYMNAPDVAGTGYKFCGNATEEDLNMPRDGLNDGILVRLEDSDAPEGDIPSAWSGATLRAPIGTHNGSDHALVHAVLPAGAEIGTHSLSNAETIYYVEAGEGEAAGDSAGKAIRPESFVFVPKGEAHSIRNTGSGPMELYVVLTGANSLSAAA
ncbi:MAG: cupin domain-containing protein [Alphaproteobacteria bacterium]|jgi:mannose-6-phosphate isomerase-like protein (cupin superfamily)|nr:cupin domain-containing protein [Alphaproteobacteria bacterium]